MLNGKQAIGRYVDPGETLLFDPRKHPSNVEKGRPRWGDTWDAVVHNRQCSDLLTKSARCCKWNSK